MYLSALSNVDVTLYDVANIDGANRWQKIKNIIWPTIKPTTTILLIMNLGNVLNSDYTKILLMQNDTNRSQLEVIGTFVYQKGIVEGKFSYATAVNLFISAIGIWSKHDYQKNQPGKQFVVGGKIHVIWKSKKTE